MSQTIQQQRAQFAMTEVDKLKNNLDEKEQKEFVSYASSLPAMIHMNGLGQAMAFCKVKGQERRSYRVLYEFVSTWLCKSTQVYADCDDVLKGITERDMHTYQLAQAEAIVLMSWVKKFAKAFLAEEKQEEEDK